MDEVAARARTIEGLQAYGWPKGNVSPPAAIVSYPDGYTFDATYGRGEDTMSLPLVLVVGLANDRAARDNLGAYCDGSGGRSIKQVLESGTYTSFGELRVASVEFDVVQIGGVDYLAALYTLDISGEGA